jgi:bifunctional non-homologous end joining protein LigD
MQKELPEIEPVILLEKKYAFDDPAYLFELKYDGFRGLAYVKEGACRLVSRNGSSFKGFTDLRAAIAHELLATDSILDGEIVSLTEQGGIAFNELMNRRGLTCYYAFDLLMLNGKDLRQLPLIQRKQKLREVIPHKSNRLLYADHIVEKGKALFKVARENDVEGIIAKPLESAYGKKARWYKIMNPRYSQTEGREEMFKEYRSR